MRPDSLAPCSRSGSSSSNASALSKSAPKAQGRGHRYQLTSSGHDLFKVCEALGEWGARWLEIAPENLDPLVALWSMCNALRRDRLPDQRVVIRLDFTGFRPHERYWLLLEHGEPEICKTYPGLDEDLYITADAEAFVKWHAGQLSWEEATRGLPDPAPRSLMALTAFPSWNGRQHVRPHQARRRRCHRVLTQRPAAEVRAACVHLVSSRSQSLSPPAFLPGVVKLVDMAMGRPPPDVGSTQAAWVPAAMAGVHRDGARGRQIDDGLAAIGSPGGGHVVVVQHVLARRS